MIEAMQVLHAEQLCGALRQRQPGLGCEAEAEAAGAQLEPATLEYLALVMLGSSCG